MAEQKPELIPLNRKNTARKLYFLGLCLLAVGLPLSMFLMSVSQFILLGAWLIDGDIKSKLRSFYNNKPALIIAGFFILHAIGLIHTSNLDFGLNDLRIKLPLLILPLVMAGFPRLSLNRFRLLGKIFILAVLISTFISMLVFWGLTEKEVNNVRDISIFISHIRLSLLICVAIFFLGWLIRESDLQGEKFRRNLWFIPIVWLVFFLIILESITGLGVLLIVAVVLSAIRVFTSKRKMPAIIFLILIFLSGLYVLKYSQDSYEKVSYYAALTEQELDSKSKDGCTYFFDLKDNQFENGHKVWAFICWEELESSWEKRSELSLDAKDKKNQELKVTLIRFLSSKGLHKDKEGVLALTDEDVHHIEMGIANCNYVKRGSVFSRIDQIVWEYHSYKMNGNPSGHSATQRLEYWAAAKAIISDNLMSGVGTGDPPEAYRNEYVKQDSKLSERWRLRAHNQYLAIGVALGIPGIIYFLFFLIYPGLVLGKFRDLLFLSFWVVACVSMITEDTLETQAGVTFFAFFYCFFLLAKQNDPAIMVQSES